MGTLKQAVDRVTAAKTAIGNAITAKGGTVNQGDGLEEFAADIATITNQYTAGDEGKVVSSGALVAQTSTTASTNGTIDTTTNNEVVVNVPNTYTAGDEGKVVSNGALVAQTARSSTITDNGTYDTTLYNSVTVNIPTGTPIYNMFISNAVRVTNAELFFTIVEGHLYIFGSCVTKYEGVELSGYITAYFDENQIKTLSDFGYTKSTYGFVGSYPAANSQSAQSTRTQISIDGSTSYISLYTASDRANTNANIVGYFN